MHFLATRKHRRVVSQSCTQIPLVAVVAAAAIRRGRPACTASRRYSACRERCAFLSLSFWRSALALKVPKGLMRRRGGSSWDLTKLGSKTCLSDHSSAMYTFCFFHTEKDRGNERSQRKRQNGSSAPRNKNYCTLAVLNTQTDDFWFIVRSKAICFCCVSLPIVTPPPFSLSFPFSVTIIMSSSSEEEDRKPAAVERPDPDTIVAARTIPTTATTNHQNNTNTTTSTVSSQSIPPTDTAAATTFPPLQPAFRPPLQQPPPPPAYEHARYFAAAATAMAAAKNKNNSSNNAQDERRPPESSVLADGKVAQQHPNNSPSPPQQQQQQQRSHHDHSGSNHTTAPSNPSNHSQGTTKLLPNTNYLLPTMSRTSIEGSTTAAAVPTTATAVPTVTTQEAGTSSSTTTAATTTTTTSITGGALPPPPALPSTGRAAKNNTVLLLRKAPPAGGDPKPIDSSGSDNDMSSSQHSLGTFLDSLPAVAASRTTTAIGNGSDTAVASNHPTAAATTKMTFLDDNEDTTKPNSSVGVHAAVPKDTSTTAEDAVSRAAAAGNEHNSHNDRDDGAEPGLASSKSASTSHHSASPSSSPPKNNKPVVAKKKRVDGSPAAVSEIQRRAGFGARTLRQLRDATAGWYRQQSAQSSQTTTCMLTLHFNEASVQAVAGWTTGSNNTSTTLINPRYRRCGACCRYGHYEVECPSLTRAQTVRFARDLTSLSSNKKTTKKAAPVATTTTTEDRTDTNDLKSPRRYDVVTECCEGYLIEQRAESEQKQPLAAAAGEQTAAVLEEVDGDNCFLLAAASADALVTNDDDDAQENAPPPKAELKHGDLVAWYVGQESLLDGQVPVGDDKRNGDVCAGTVKDDDLPSGKVLVKVLKTIPSKPQDRQSQENNSEQPAADDQPQQQEQQVTAAVVHLEDSLVWVRREALHLVVESSSSSALNRALLGKRKPAWMEPGPKPPKMYRPPRQKDDGTFARPCGRPPGKKEFLLLLVRAAVVESFSLCDAMQRC